MDYTLITHGGFRFFRKKLSLKEQQDFVGGYIEICGNVISNEDGRLLNLPVNKLHPAFVGNIILFMK